MYILMAIICNVLLLRLFITDRIEKKARLIISDKFNLPGSMLLDDALLLMDKRHRDLILRYAYSPLKMIFDIRKWTFRQFYPELVNE